MKNILLMTTTALALLAAPAFAQGCNAGCQLNRWENNAQYRTTPNLTRILRELDNEDQRLVSGAYDPTTGTLTLHTEDMIPGADGDISRRDVVITGLQARDGTDGANGRDGIDGADGTNGRDGADAVFPQDSLDRMMDRYGHSLAASTALGGLEIRTPGEGDWSLGGGIGGIIQGGDSFEAISLGVRYGISDRVSVYAKVSQSLQGNSTSWFVGAEMLLGGSR